MAVAHIEITNHCTLQCTNCTRFCDKSGHERYYMSIEDVRKAIRSLKGFKQQIGIMGGEPTLHPKFREICWEMTVVPKAQRSLWTNGFNYEKYKDVIEDTFLPENIIYNDHKDDKDYDIHHPLHYRSKDIVKDDFLRGLLTGNCWVQWRWGASINPKGAYFCEVAAAMDMKDNGNYGYKVEPGWWDRNPNDFIDQVMRFCPNCSACVPMDGDIIGTKKSRRVNRRTTESILRSLKNWRPWEHRKVSKDGNYII